MTGLRPLSRVGFLLWVEVVPDMPGYRLATDGREITITDTMATAYDEFDKPGPLFEVLTTEAVAEDIRRKLAGEDVHTMWRVDAVHPGECSS